MKWPFRRKHDETDIRVFRDPKTGILTLRLTGEIGWPSGPETEPFISVNVSLRTEMTEAVAMRLRAIDTLIPPES